MQKRLFLLPAVLAVVFFGASCTKTATTHTTTNTTANTNAALSFVVSYAGQEGKSALELLQANHQVEASAEGFVSSIDGQAPGDRQYWALYLNGTLADKGAKDLITKNTDQIGWRLDNF